MIWKILLCCMLIGLVVLCIIVCKLASTIRTLQAVYDVQVEMIAGLLADMEMLKKPIKIK